MKDGVQSLAGTVAQQAMHNQQVQDLKDLMADPTGIEVQFNEDAAISRHSEIANFQSQQRKEIQESEPDADDMIATYRQQQSVQTFAEFIQKFEDLFTRTISDENKPESEFVPEYAALAEVLKDFINRCKGSANWSKIFISLQEEANAFKKPLRTLD